MRFLAETYRSFAKEHRELYWLIMNMAAKDNRLLDDAAVLFTDPIKKVLEDFNLKEEESIHYRRLFRAIVHGFVSQEEQGFFSHYPAEVDGSFHFAVQCYIDLSLIHISIPELAYNQCADGGGYGSGTDPV